MLIALAGCASQPSEETKSSAGALPAAKEPAVARPQTPARPPGRDGAAAERPQQPPAEPVPSRGSQLLAQGVKSYEEGDYRSASRQLAAALHEELPAGEQASAHKYLAFLACTSKRVAACRDEFRKAFAADATFDLSPAEAGHPTWGPAFRRVKAEIAAKSKQKRTP